MITLTLASGSGIEGGTLPLTLTIASTSGDACTSVQFTLSYNPADLTLTSAVAGASATGASKMVNRAGNLIVIWGLNTNVIADGTLCTLNFLVSNPVTHGSIPITLTSIVASDASANPLSTTGVAGTVTVNIVTIACPVGGGSASKGQNYSAQLLASGGTGPYTFTITG